MAENVFEAVKQSVSTREAAEFYGIKVSRTGMACCPFHDDKNPSIVGCAVSMFMLIITAYPLCVPEKKFPASKYIKWFFLANMMFSGGLIPFLDLYEYTSTSSRLLFQKEYGLKAARRAPQFSKR